MSHPQSLAARLGGLTLYAAAVTATAGQAELDLAEAERLALAQDPLIGRFHSLAEANREQAVAEGQLPDPKLRLGALNFPTDSFNRSQEPMTQLLVGLSQAFPRGDTLALKRRQSEQGIWNWRRPRNADWRCSGPPARAGWISTCSKARPR